MRVPRASASPWQGERRSRASAWISPCSGPAACWPCPAGASRVFAVKKEGTGRRKNPKESEQ